jgi:hypothetical protein
MKGATARLKMPTTTLLLLLMTPMLIEDGPRLILMAGQRRAWRGRTERRQRGRGALAHPALRVTAAAKHACQWHQFHFHQNHQRRGGRCYLTP